MSDTENPNAIRSNIWREEPEPDNAFATRAAYCRGYDVYGEMLGHARWVEMLYLLFQKEAPTKLQADMLEALAVGLANPGPRDASVHAAMCGGVCGSTAASSLMAALAVGAGNCQEGVKYFWRWKAGVNAVPISTRGASGSPVWKRSRAASGLRRNTRQDLIRMASALLLR